MKRRLVSCALRLQCGLIAAVLVLVLGALGPAGDVRAQQVNGTPQALPLSPLQIIRAGTEGARSPPAPLAFEVEVAATPAQRTIGLMFRTQMADARGMLFTFPYPQPASFWMRNTYISLDLLFIAPDGRILNIAAEATPLSLKSIPSDGKVIAVLEIKGGLARKLGIKPGDLVQHAALKPDRQAD